MKGLVSAAARCVLLSLAFLLTQCKEKPLSFYKDSMHGHDVWRLPIVEPHELITADCFTICRGWNYQRDIDSSSVVFNPDSINFEDNHILFHSETFHGERAYGVLSTVTNELTYLPNRQKFIASTRNKKLNPNLFHTTTVYRNWCETGQLPWAKEILATQKGI